MIKELPKYKKRRKDMVENHIKSRLITDPRVIDAMLKVPRHIFVNEAMMDIAYEDTPLPIGERQTISQPYIVALMTEALKLDKDDRVLEIGTGSGYQAAILAEIVFKVYTIERIHSLFTNARKIFEKLEYCNIVAKYGDGTMGWQEESPFDAIIVTAGAPNVPSQLLSQLKTGGRMALPVGSSDIQDLVKITRTESGIETEPLCGCRFVKLIGRDGFSD